MPSKKSLKTAAIQQPFSLLYCIHESIVVLIFGSAHNLSKALLRPHISYEGAQLKGPLKGLNFPLEFYKSWAHSVTDFSEEESKVLDFLNSLDPPPEYLLAAIKGDSSTLYHEWAHAQYFLKEPIRQLASQMYNNLPEQLKKIVDHELYMRGYEAQVYVDEFQAYLLESPQDFGKKWAHLLKPHHDLLRRTIPRPVLQFRAMGE